MALTRGPTADYPCPQCLISKQSLGDLSAEPGLRTVEGTMTILEAAREKSSGEKEKMLQAVGLRDVDVYFPFFSYFNCTTSNNQMEYILEDQSRRPVCCIVV